MCRYEKTKSNLETDLAKEGGAGGACIVPIGKKGQGCKSPLLKKRGSVD